MMLSLQNLTVPDSGYGGPIMVEMGLMVKLGFLLMGDIVQQIKTGTFSSPERHPLWEILPHPGHTNLYTEVDYGMDSWFYLTRQDNAYGELIMEGHRLMEVRGVSVQILAAYIYSEAPIR